MLRTMHRRRLGWLALGLGLGCWGKEDTGSAAEATQDVVWAGWNHTWEKLSHRVSLIRAIAEPDGRFSTGIRGGDWSTGDAWADEAAYRMQLQRVSGRGLQIVHGETLLTVGPDGTATEEATAEISADTVAVVLRGFEIETDVAQGAAYPDDYDPVLGYTSRGFGFSVGEPTVHGEDITFEVGAQVRWGPRDREDMNRAMEAAQTRVWVAWTAIGHPGTQSRIRMDDAVDLTHAPPYSTQAGLQLSTGLDGGPGIVGITHFDLGLGDQDGGEGGDYLRSFGVEVQVDGGMAPSQVLAEITTSSVIELGTMHFAPEVDLIWITPDVADLKVEVVIYEGTHGVGEFEIDPMD